VAVLRGVATVLALLAVSTVVARRRLMVVTAFGSSMEPTFPTGTRLLVLRTGRVRRGDVVVLLHQDERPRDDPFASHYLVKRLAALPGDDVPTSVATIVESQDGRVPAGRAVVLGDSEHSTDSRSWGYVPLGDIVGRSIRRLERLDPDAILPAQDGQGAVGPEV